MKSSEWIQIWQWIPGIKYPFNSFHKETVTEMKVYSPYFLFNFHVSLWDGEGLAADMCMWAQNSSKWGTITAVAERRGVKNSTFKI